MRLCACRASSSQARPSAGARELLRFGRRGGRASSAIADAVAATVCQTCLRTSACAWSQTGLRHSRYTNLIRRELRCGWSRWCRQGRRRCPEPGWRALGARRVAARFPLRVFPRASAHDHEPACPIGMLILRPRTAWPGRSVHAWRFDRSARRFEDLIRAGANFSGLIATRLDVGATVDLIDGRGAFRRR